MKNLNLFGIFNRNSQIEVDGNWEGIHGVNPQAKLAEISAIAEQEKEKISLNFIDNEKNTEAERDITAVLLAEANRFFATYQSLANSKVPSFVMPVLAFLGAITTTLAEVFFLAPLLEGLGISSYYERLIIAFAFVFTVGVLLKTAILFTQKERRNWWIIGSVFAADLIFAGSLGIWRYFQMSFTSESNAELNRFLTETSFLSPLVLTLLTVFLGMASTAAINFGTEKLGLYFSFRKFLKRKNRLQKRFETLDKKLEGLHQKLEKRKNYIDQKAEEFKQSYLNAYQNGIKNKPLKEDWQLVVTKISAVTLSVFSGVLIFAYSLADESFSNAVQTGFGRFLIYCSVSTSISMFFSYLIVKSWQRPNKTQTYKKVTLDWTQFESNTNQTHIEEITLVTPKFNGNSVVRN